MYNIQFNLPAVILHLEFRDKFQSLMTNSLFLRMPEVSWQCTECGNTKIGKTIAAQYYHIRLLGNLGFPKYKIH